MNSKSNALLLFIGSVGLILIAIVFSSVIDKSKNSEARPDSRAKASNSGSMSFYGTAGTYDPATNTLSVDNLMFSDSQNKSLGSWKITVPGNFNSTAYPSGTRLKISANPATFQIAEKTLTASDISRR